MAQGVRKCQDCSSTTCRKCGGRPEHNFEEGIMCRVPPQVPLASAPAIPAYRASSERDACLCLPCSALLGLSPAGFSIFQQANTKW